MFSTISGLASRGAPPIEGEAKALAPASQERLPNGTLFIHDGLLDRPVDHQGNVELKNVVARAQVVAQSAGNITVTDCDIDTGAELALKAAGDLAIWSSNVHGNVQCGGRTFFLSKDSKITGNVELQQDAMRPNTWIGVVKGQMEWPVEKDASGHQHVHIPASASKLRLKGVIGGSPLHVRFKEGAQVGKLIDLPPGTPVTVVGDPWQLKHPPANVTFLPRQDSKSVPTSDDPSGQFVRDRRCASRPDGGGVESPLSLGRRLSRLLLGTRPSDATEANRGEARQTGVGSPPFRVNVVNIVNVVNVVTVHRSARARIRMTPPATTAERAKPAEPRC